MKEGFFQSIQKYLGTTRQALESLGRAVFTGLQYLRGMGELKKEVTEQYPDPVSARSVDERSPRTRGKIANDIAKCTGCGDCLLACPTQCIEVQVEQGHAPGKLWVSVFNVDHSKCIFCGLCVSACLPQSLSHTKTHHFATESLEELKTAFGKGPVSPELRQLWERQRMINERDSSL